MAANTQAITDFANRLAAIPQQVRDGARAVIEKTVKEFESRVQSAIPESPNAPHLKETIEIFEGDPIKMEKGIRVGSTALVYAMSLEFGHRTKNGAHVPPNPFFVPVRRIMAKKHRNRMRYAIRKALKVAFP